MKLFLICGKADTGKNFFGEMLKKEFEKNEYKVCMLRLTEPLYNYAIKYFSWDGDESSKPRRLLQNLGIEVIKEKLGLKDFLINRLKDDITILDEYFDVGIITDGRLIYEIEKLKEYYPSIKTIKMERLKGNSLTRDEQNHITEKDQDREYNYDYVIKNEDVESLKEFAKVIYSKERYFEIAIDGPSSTGKSTVSKLIAEKKSFIHIDTGAMYRALSLYYINNGIDYNNEKEVEKYLSIIDVEIKIDGKIQKVYLNNKDVTSLIRNEEVSRAASVISTYKKVREKLLVLQKRLSKRSNVVMDGRDIGTFVIPFAFLKIYLDADKNIRALRRYKEYKDKNIDITLDKVKEDLEERDNRDMNRKTCPLKCASDAVVIDSSNLTINEVCEKIISLYEEKRNLK